MRVILILAGPPEAAAHAGNSSHVRRVVSKIFQGGHRGGQVVSFGGQWVVIWLR